MGKKKTPKQATVQFTVPAFRHKGVEYKSAEVEARINEGDVEAEALVRELVEKGSAVVDIVHVDAVDLQAEAQAEAEKKEKAAAAKKAKDEAKAEAKAKKSTKTPE
ncbi:MAG: hypothetical protein K8H85_04285 [Cyclobacteriaceae bacterium]|nr:hypothetical protein [Cyclobacteriaceae bacterium]